MSRVVVLGAGVSGLTCALQLARDGRYDITIVAKHMPGDYDIEYASPWAGANYTPGLTKKMLSKSRSSAIGDLGKEAVNNVSVEYEQASWKEMERLARELPESGLHFQESRSGLRSKDVDTPAGKEFLEDLQDPWLRENMPNFRELPKAELPDGFVAVTSFTSVCINTTIYLSWLASQCLKHGVVIKRGIVKHINDAAKRHHTGESATVVVNCTGLSSLFLKGVEDTALFPVRGQIVMVRNSTPYMWMVSGVDADDDETTYTMTRAAGGGCALGGCMQVNNWESQPDLDLANRIMQRCVQLTPELVEKGQGVEGLSVIRHAVGLRPMRRGGIRVEKEVIDGLTVVHNYGHGGSGYQTSYGAAAAVCALVEGSTSEQA